MTAVLTADPAADLASACGEAIPEEDRMYTVPGQCGFVGSIPVRNLWLLMFYASHLFREQGRARISLEDAPDDIPDLVARILCSRVEQRLRRNLSQDFRSREAVLNRVRGRIDILTTERNALLERGQIACRFEELTANTVRNRLVCAALGKLARVTGSELAARCRNLAASMQRLGVTGTCPTQRELAADCPGLRDIQDAAMVAAARLAFALALPTEGSGTHLLSRPERQRAWVCQLFEKGVAGFYKTVLADRGWQVTAGKPLYWPIAEMSPCMEAIFPRMRTDIILEQTTSKRCIVVDTKFNALLTKGWYREKTLRSEYVYQMYAYLRSQETGEGGLRDHASGLLLHPATGLEMDEHIEIQGHRIRFATVDLSARTRAIRDRLLQVVDCL